MSSQERLGPLQKFENPLQFAPPGESDPNPEKYGLKIDPVRTVFLREYTDQTDALVLDKIALTANPEGYFRYQRDLVLKIARDLGISPEEERLHEDSLPLPQFFSGNDAANQRSIQEFRRLERELKIRSPWQWLLLREDIQGEFFKRLPYVSVPPYIVEEGHATPLSEFSWPASQTRNIKSRWVHDLPALDQITIRRIPGTTRRTARVERTIPGIVVREALKGGWCYIDHAIPRLWAAGIPLDPEAYRTDQPKYPIDADVDILLAGGINIGKMILRVNRLTRAASQRARRLFGILENPSPWTSIMMGVSMTTDVEYLITIKNPTSDTRNLDPYKAAHSSSCLVQGIQGWVGQETAGKSNLLLPTLVTLSELRSIGMLPFQVTRKNGRPAFTAKFVDILGGLRSFVEVNGGVSLDAKRNIIRMTDIVGAFPDNNLQLWHLTRTIADLIAHAGGVYFPSYPHPSENLQDPAYVHDAIKLGAEELRGVVARSRASLPRALERLKGQELQLQDLAMELSEGAKEAFKIDPLSYLVLCSGSDISYFDRGLEGVELHTLFPNLHELYMQPGAWDEMLRTVAFLEPTRRTWKNSFTAVWRNETVRSAIINALHKRFLARPTQVGIYMLKNPPEVSGDRTYDWGILDSVLTGYVDNSISWKKFLALIETSGDSFQTIEEYLKHLRKTASVYTNSHIRRAEWTSARRRRMTARHESGLESRQTQALLDWMFDPGF